MGTLCSDCWLEALAAYNKSLSTSLCTPGPVTSWSSDGGGGLEVVRSEDEHVPQWARIDSPTQLEATPQKGALRLTYPAREAHLPIPKRLNSHTAAQKRFDGTDVILR